MTGGEGSYVGWIMLPIKDDGPEFVKGPGILKQNGVAPLTPQQVEQLIIKKEGSPEFVKGSHILKEHEYAMAPLTPERARQLVRENPFAPPYSRRAEEPKGEKGARGNKR